MRKIIKKAFVLILLLLPVSLLLTVFSLKEAQGPYYIGPVYDSEYTYLLASLNAANFKVSKLTLHPGTPIQTIGGAFLRIQSPNYSTLQTDVLKHPEAHLNRLNGFVIAINFILLIVLGVVIYSLTGDKPAALLIQLTPFLSNSIITCLTRFNPEPFLVFSSFLLILALLKKSLKISSEDRKYTLIFGLIAGFGLAVKIPFFPLLIIPVFVFKKFSNILKYVFFTVISFLLLLLPYYERFAYSFRWLWKLSSHTGRYGTGGRGIIDTTKLLPNVRTLFRHEPIFIYTLIILIAFVIVNLAIPRLRKIASKSVLFKILIGISAANLIGLVMVLKHFSLKYFIPCFSLSGYVIFLIYMYLKTLSKELDFNFRIVKFSFIFVFVAACFFIVSTLPNFRAISNRTARKLAVYQNILYKYRDYNRISYYGSTSKLFALRHGNDWARYYHSDALKSIYGRNVYFYDIFRKAFFRWNYRIPVTQLARNYKKTIMFGPMEAKGRSRLNIIERTRNILAKNNLKLINTQPGIKDDTVFKFGKIQPDSVLKAKELTILKNLRDTDTPDIARNINFGNKYKLVKAFIVKKNSGKTVLTILWESMEKQKAGHGKMQFRLIRNERVIFGKRQMFSESDLNFDKGDLVKSEIAFPAGKFAKADFLSINFFIQPRLSRLKLTINNVNADQRKSSLLIRINERNGENKKELR